MQLTLAEVAHLCGGKLTKGSDPNKIIRQVVIDSRQATESSLFISIKGEVHDGHDFVAAAIKSNAACVVSQSQYFNLPNLIQVNDTTLALGKLASGYREHFQIPVAAITGSNGKTTVKEMLKKICELEFGLDNVIATQGNLNNHWGMPLTLLKLEPKHKVAILEMGMNHKGEINYLSTLAKPTIAVVNNVMWAHAGFFNGLEGIAAAKGEIYNGLTTNGVACVNLMDKFGQYWLDNLHAKPKPAKLFTYGTKESECYLANADDCGNFTITTSGGNITGTLQVLGVHNCYNALTATAVALNLGCSLANIAAGLNGYTGYSRRLERKVAFNGSLMIDDSYNANPDSVKAAILAIKSLPRPHWFILGNLGELGDLTETLHQDVGKFAKNNGIDVLLTVGELARFARVDDKISSLHFSNNADLVEYCLKNLPAAATLLIKGSLSANLAEVVNQLIKK